MSDNQLSGRQQAIGQIADSSIVVDSIAPCIAPRRRWNKQLRVLTGPQLFFHFGSKHTHLQFS
jgi:hypothetical protein